MDNFTAAKKPIIDHTNGSIKNNTFVFLLIKRNIPNVKIVVGHGNPNVGEYGYVWPKLRSSIGYIIKE